MDRRELIQGLGIGAAAMATPSVASAKGPVQSPAFDSGLAGRLEAIAASQRLAGAALAIARGGRLLASWTFGYASLQHRVPVGTDTLFASASVGKHVTATGILRLVDAGRIDLDGTIGSYLKEVPADWAGRTVRSLLNHTSGLPDFTLAPKTVPGAADPTREQMIERMRFREPLFDTGEGWSYCNSNYLILGWMIEDALGMPLSDALRDSVLRPAGARTARTDGPGVVTANLAEPYVHDRRYWRIPFEQTDIARGSDTLQWSIGDIAPWGDALLSHRVVSRASARAGLAWSRLRSGASVPYGFGFFLDRVAGRPVHWHNGGAPGTVGMFLQLPADDLTVAVMSNTDTPTRTMRSMAWLAVDAFSPRSTYLGLAGLAPDGLDTSVARLAEKPGPLAPDPSLIAPDLLRVLRDPTEQRRFNPGFRDGTRIERIEEYRAGNGLMRRYRIRHADGAVDYRLAGFDSGGKLFWLWAC